MMDSLSNDPNDALVFHFNRNCHDKLVGSACTENEPLDVSSIISTDGAGQESDHSAVEKVVIWVNGVKRVIFVPLGNNPTEPCDPREPDDPTKRRSPDKVCDSVVAADASPASLPVADVKTSSRSDTESCSRNTVVTCCAGENTVLSKSVSTNTVDQLPNRCVATVAPQINRELGRLLVSSAFDDASQSKESSVKQAASSIKLEKLTSSTNCLNVRPGSDDALALGANISQNQPSFHQRQLTEYPRLLNLNEWHYQDRYDHLQRPGYDQPGRLPAAHSLTRTAVPHSNLYAYATESNSARFALPDSFIGRYRLPTQVAPYLLRPLRATGLASNSLGPNGGILGRAENNHFSGVGVNELCSNRSAQVSMQVSNAPPLLGGPTVMVPNLPLQRYQHLMSSLDPAKQPYSYGRFGAQDNTRLPNVYAPLARFPSRADFPYPQFAVRPSNNEQVAAQVVRGDILHPQFPARLPIDEQVAQITSFNNGHRLFGHYPNYMNSFVSVQNQARHGLHVPSSIVSFNEQPSKIYLSESNQHLQSIGFGQAARTSLNFKQPETVPGGNLILQRVHLNQPKISPAVPEMSQKHPLPASYLHNAHLQGFEHVPSLRVLNGAEQPTLHVPHKVSHRLPSTAVAQPFRPSPTGPASHETTQSNIFQPMNLDISQSSIYRPILYNNAYPLNVPEFVREPHKNVEFLRNVIPCSQTDSLSQHVAVSGSKPADEQHGSSLHATWYSSPSSSATFSQNLVSQSFLSASPGVPLRSVSQNIPAGYSQRLCSPGVQTTQYLQTLSLSDTSRSRSDVDVENHLATRSQSHVSSICSSIQVADTFRNCYIFETNNKTIPVLPLFGARKAVCDPQPCVSAGSALSVALTSTNKVGDKSLDARLADSNNKSAEVAFKGNTVPLCSSESVLDASHKDLAEITVSSSLNSQLEPSNNLQPSTEMQDPQSQVVSLPGSPQSPMSEIMNSIDKISDDLSMQKWLDSLIGNISDSSKDGFDSQSKSKTADLAVNQTSIKDTTTPGDTRALVCPPSITKQVDVKKSKRTWIGIKSIEAEMSPESSKVKSKRRKRRRLTMKSNQSPEGSCDASSDSWHPDSFASSESSMDSNATSIPSAQTSCTELSWCSDDSVTIGKRCKNRSRKSHSRKNRTERSRHKRTRRSRNLSPWCRTRPCLGQIRGCFVSLEMLCLKGKASVNVARANDFLCCSSKTKHRFVQGGSDTEDSHGSGHSFKRKKHVLKRDSKRKRNIVNSGSDTENSYSAQKRPKSRKLILKLRYSKPSRNVILSGSDTE